MNYRTVIKIFLGLIALTIGYGFFITHQLVECVRRPYLDFHVLDVGQGDALLLQTCYHFDMLVDGGPDNQVVYQLGTHLPYWDRTIDLVVLTHPDADHVTGLVEVLRRYTVGHVLVTGVNGSTQTYRAFWQAIADNHIPVIIAGAVSHISIDQQFKLDVLYPFKSLWHQDITDTNESSIVIRAQYARSSILLTGDTSQNIEHELLRQLSRSVLDVDILKVAHHGSKTSSAVDFLRATTPALAVISSGKDNKYHHPSPITLEHFDQLGIGWLDTQDVGTISMRLNLEGYHVLKPGT